MAAFTLPHVSLAAGWSTQFNAGTALNAVHFFDSYTGLAVGANGKIFRSTDMGRTWTLKPSGVVVTLKDIATPTSVLFTYGGGVHQAVQPFGAQTAWVVGENGTILKTEDGGQTWVAQNNPLAGTNLNSVYFINANTGWTVGNNGVVLTTTDGGQRWTWQSLTPQTLRGVVFVDANTGWTVGDGGTIFQTLDGGKNWWPQVSGTVNDLLGVFFVSLNHGYAVGRGGTVLTTTDGTTWNRKTIDWRDFQRIQFLDANQGWVVGGDRDFYTEDGGATWKNEYTLTPGRTYVGIQMVNAKLGWTVNDAGDIAMYDGVPPSPAGALSLTGGSPTSDATPTFTWNAALDGETGIDSYSASIDPGGYVNIGNVLTFTASSNLSDGTHVFSLWANDKAGNRSQTDLSFVVDTTPPAVGTISPQNATAGQAVTLSASATDADGITSCDLSVGGVPQGGMSVANNQATFVYTFQSAGTYSASATCRDKAGISATGIPVTITVAAAALQIDTTPAALASTVVASVNSIPADNTSISSITVTVKNSAGTALPNKNVSLASSRPGSDSVSVAGSQITNAQGQVMFTVRSGIAGTSIYTASADGVTLGQVSVGFSQVNSQTTITPRLIKLACVGAVRADDPCKAVYFLGTDGKRHAFPNEKVYFTWYVNFDGVEIVTPAAMASISLGKNVVYRPGVRMVKFTTLNKVYAVTKGGALRWVTSEDVARSLYGAAWNKKIDDISDVFYLDYTFGADVIATSDFNVVNETASVTLDQNLSL